MLYPQNGNRVVGIDFVTSFHPMYSCCRRATCGPRKFGPTDRRTGIYIVNNHRLHRRGRDRIPVVGLFGYPLSQSNNLPPKSTFNLSAAESGDQMVPCVCR